MAVPHTVAVVGRENSNNHAENTGFEDRLTDMNPIIGLPDQWNETAVICDPWARVAYPAKDYNQF